MGAIYAEEWQEAETGGESTEETEAVATEDYGVLDEDGDSRDGSHMP
jgi:hypothetical protein